MQIESQLPLYIIVVFFNPTEEDIEYFRQLATQYQGICVDNSSIPTFQQDSIGKMLYLACNKNLGIAEAQNIGIRHLMGEEGIVVFLDQDSRFPLDYPLLIAKEFQKYTAQNIRLGIIGPTVVNIKDKQEYQSIIHKHHTIADGLVVQREIISSGACTSISVLKQIGLNDARLFIDYVDFDLCWRANANGYQCATTRSLRIMHQVGNKNIWIGKYLIIISSPFRYFYQYRNYLWLIRRNYVPLQWKIATGIKFIARLIYFPLLVKDGINCWKYMIKGIKSGIKKPKELKPDNSTDCIL